MFAGYRAAAIHDDFSSLCYSGSWVYRVHLLKGGDRPELPLVVKIAPASLIAREVRAYDECVRNQWPGIAQLRGPPVYLAGSDLGGLCYPLTGGGVFKMVSLREYCLEAETEDILFVLAQRLFKIMEERILLPARNVFEHPLRASYDAVLPVNLLVSPEPPQVGGARTPATSVSPGAPPDPLLQVGDRMRVEGFVVTEVSPRQRSVTLNVPRSRSSYAYRLRLQPVEDLSPYVVGQVMPPTEGIVRETRQTRLRKELRRAMGPAFDPSSETVAVSAGADGRPTVLPNPLLAVPRILSAARHVKVNGIHGDLNLENVLVDPQVRDVRLIDFAEARQDHVLHDYLRLETEVAVKLLPVALAKAGLPAQAACLAYERLHCATFQHGQARPLRPPHPALDAPFATLCAIREAARDGFYDRDDYSEYYQGLVLYLLSALKYRNLDEIPEAKQIAFWCAAAVQRLLHADPPCAEVHPPYRADALCPYRGLYAFQEEHAPLFFGREELTRRILDKLRVTLETGEGHRLLAIIGPSGSGKSSLAQAGLVAALKQGQLAGSQDWQVVHCRPGAQPAENLCAALYKAKAIDLSEAEDLRAGMLEGERALYYTTYAFSHERRLVLLIDQFEEVYTLCRDEVVRRAYISNLLYAAGVIGGQVVVVLTLRADFYGHCAAYGLSKVLPASQMLIEPLTENELQRAIQQPAYLAGREFEVGLVERLLDDVRDQAGRLPLLQHALLELWTHSEGSLLTHAAYDEIGRVAGALERRAEMVYEALSPFEQAVCQRIFLRLTQPGEGMVDTSRRASYAELLSAGGDAAELENVVRKLADARLVTTEGSETERHINVAHEALIQGWGRLRAWIDENRESLIFHRRLTQAAGEWAENGRDPSYLYWGGRLAQADLWAEEHEGDLSEVEQAFLTASWAEREARRRSQAQARSRRLARLARDHLGDERELALLLAIEAGRAANTPEADEALQSALIHRRTLRLAGHTGAVKHVSWDSSGSRLATASADRTARVWALGSDQEDAASAVRRVHLRGHTDEVWWVAWSRSDTRLATASDDGTARVWDAESGDPLTVLAGHRGWIYHTAWSMDDTCILTAGGDGTARVWDADSGEQLLLLAAREVGSTGLPASADRSRQRDRVVHAAWNADSTRIVTACADGIARVWDAGSGDLLLSLPHDAEVRSSVYRVRWSPEGRRIVTASYDRTARVWDAGGGHPLAVLSGHTRRVYYAAWSPDGTRIVTTSADDTARVWDAHSGDELAVLSGHRDEVRYAAWNGAGTWIVTVSEDGTARVWDAGSGDELAVLHGHTRAVGHVSWNRAGTRFATAGDDGTACVWVAEDIERFAVRAGHLDTGDLLEAASQRAARSLTREERYEYVGDEPYLRS
jgi:WD40 repeat protein